MRTSRMTIVLVFMLALLLFAACQKEPSPEKSVEVTRVVTEVVEVEGETVEVTVVVTEMALEVVEAAPQLNNQLHNFSNTTQQERLIIKTADMSVTVEQADQALETAINVTLNVDGYILNQQVWERGGLRYATVRVGVPVETFEQVMRSFRTLGIVTAENASGEDVTEEFVDLESRLENLHITQERLQTFLSQATKIADVIELNRELSAVEEELGVIQGRMNYLSNRAAFSTIALSLNPLVPTPTPSPTPTPTPIPTAESWRPADTVKTAQVELQESFQDTADFVIYNLIARGPWLFLVGVVGVIGWRSGRKRGWFKQQSPP